MHFTSRHRQCNGPPNTTNRFLSQTVFTEKGFKKTESSEHNRVLLVGFDGGFWGGWGGALEKKNPAQKQQSHIPLTFQDTTFKTGKLCPLTADSLVTSTFQFQGKKAFRPSLIEVIPSAFQGRQESSLVVTISLTSKH